MEKTATQEEKIIHSLYRQWKKLGVKEIDGVRTQDAWTLHGDFPNQEKRGAMTVNATAMSCFGTKTVCLLFDAVVPCVLPIETRMFAICEFSQPASWLMSPLSLVMDIESKQLIVRYSHLVTSDAVFSFMSFIFAAQKWVPLITECAENIISHDYTPEQARKMATYLSGEFYGENVS